MSSVRGTHSPINQLCCRTCISNLLFSPCMLFLSAVSLTKFADGFYTTDIASVFFLVQLILLVTLNSPLIFTPNHGLEMPDDRWLCHL